MVVDHLIQSINDIRDQLINLSPEDQTPSMIEEKQEKLRILLEEAASLTGEDRVRVRQVVDDFSAVLSERVQFLQNNLEEMHRTAQESQKRQQGARAYSGKLF